MNYDITYEILNYEKYHKRLDSILNNPNYKYKVEKCENLGYTECGFPIEHYKIGNGRTHILYMAGCHGNELITVDYVTQLMKNLSLGLGEFSSFDPDEFTIDFIPCQNPEGFFATTYALDFFMKDMTCEEIERFSKEYYSLYKKDDINVLTIHKMVKTFCEYYKMSFDDMNTKFWNIFRNKEISLKDVLSFLFQHTDTVNEELKNILTSFWQQKLDLDYVIPSYKYHNNFFSGISLECIPTFDEPHQKLKDNLEKIFSTGEFPIETLATFFANSTGVNLNDNNEEYYNYLKLKIEEDKDIYANLRDNNLKKHIPGPIGAPNEDMEKPFSLTKENVALLGFLEKEEPNNFCFINCHSCGGMLFLYPVIDEELNNPTNRKFQFYINNRLATEYTRKIGDVYEENTGINSPYKTQGYPDRITGLGDVLRRNYLASFLLELSKAGGNPIGPYCDIEGNFKLTMLSNFSATISLLNTILEVKHLYDTTYSIEYNNGIATYNIR